MIKLYGAGQSRWVRPYWTLKELAVEFEPVIVELGKGEHQSSTYKSIQPFAKVPALVDGSFTLYESAAICTYLADKYPEKNLIPKVGTQTRALCEQWISFVISDLDQPLWRMTRHMFIYPKDKRSTVDIALAKEDFFQLANILEQQLTTDNLVGGRFSVADIMMTYSLKWATNERLMGGNLLQPFDRLSAYLEKHLCRPAFPKYLFK